jgi:zinc finger CCCH domain-containing protein 13
MPDGLVPGLRSVHPARARESNMFMDLPDDFSSGPRLNLQQRGAEQFYPSPLYQQTVMGRNNNIPQSQFRRGPSPISSQNAPLNVPQRQPAGLANLGRPSHDTSQFLSMGGIPQVMMHGNGSSQTFNNFASSETGAGYGAGQTRIAPPNARQLQQTGITHNPLQGLGHPGSIDMRVGQSQLVGMGSQMGGVSRAGNNGFGSQQMPSNQVPLLSMRQQQPLPQHLMPPHLLPQHLQQGHAVTTNQPAQDLMALLMGGSHRE